jgi:predicted porin
MQKKLLALAVASALAPAAALAQQSTVEIYGRANLGLDTYEAKGSSIDGNSYKSRMRVFDQGSRLGFRVNESLGGGMRAFVVLETGVNFDRGDNLGQTNTVANASSGFWASRASYAGVGGDWGDVRFGRQDVWWSNGLIAQTGANYINTAADGLTTGGFQAVAVPSTRTPNVASYNSPTFGGFNASVYWAPNGSTDTTSEGQAFTGTNQKKANLMAITGRYTGGPFRAQFDWGEHKLQSTDPTPQRKDSGWKAGVGWAYAPGSQISGVFESLKNQDAPTLFGAAGTVESRKVDMWLLNWEHMMGQWQLLAQYAQTGNIKDLSVDPGDTKSKAYTIGAKYFLSKRTGVYASYNKITNGSFAWADYTGGAISSANLVAANRGADPQIMAIGVMHNF